MIGPLVFITGASSGIGQAVAARYAKAGCRLALASRRVGENESFTVDVRVVCATHRHLEQMVEEGDFREDLMFRINTFEIQLPALRERVEDIAQLAATSGRAAVRPEVSADVP